MAERLLTTGAAGGKTETVRLAHQRALQDWARARAIVDSSADFFALRSDIEDGLRRYKDSKRGEDLLHGVRLAKAREFAKLYPDELSSEAGAYVKASRARANRGLTIAWVLAALFVAVAVGAGVAALVAWDQSVAAEAAKAQADRNFELARKTVDGLIFDVAQGLRNVSGMRTETIRKILQTAQTTVEKLTETAPDNPRLLRSRAVMFIQFTDTYLIAGDLRDAASAANQSVGIFRKLAAAKPGDARRPTRTLGEP